MLANSLKPVLARILPCLCRHLNMTLNMNKTYYPKAISNTLVDLDNNYDYLADGVYGTTISIDDKIYYGICNIGCNPTINNNITKIDFEDRERGIAALFHYNNSKGDELIYSTNEKGIRTIVKEGLLGQQKVFETIFSVLKITPF